MGNAKKWQLAGIAMLVVVLVALVGATVIQSSQRQEANEQARMDYKEQREQREQEAQEIVTGSGALVISVLGDSTGNDSNEWVQLWAQSLAEDGATVTFYGWDSSNHEWSESPVVFGEGGREVTIWNASSAGATPKYALENTGVFPDEADLLITNYGHNGTASGIRSNLSRILDEAQERWDGPSKVVTIQNPGGGAAASTSARNHDAVRSVAENRSLPVIDVNQTFEEAGDVEELLLDDVHPNGDGSALWVDTVNQFFAG